MMDAVRSDALEESAACVLLELAKKETSAVVPIHEFGGKMSAFQRVATPSDFEARSHERARRTSASSDDATLNASALLDPVYRAPERPAKKTAARKLLPVESAAVLGEWDARASAGVRVFCQLERTRSPLA